MKVELDDRTMAATLRPLLKAGWTTTLHADADRIWITVRSNAKAGGAFMTIRNAEEAAVYDGRPGDAVLFEGPDAIKDGVALALGRAS
jgi:hypothetical protein